MNFDIRKIPFSRRGSYFVISGSGKNDKLYIRDLHGGDETESNLYEIIFPGKDVELDILAEETLLTIQEQKSGGTVKFAIGESDTLHILVSGLKVQLKALGGKYDSLVPYENSRWEHILYSKERKIMCTCMYGDVEISGEWKIIGNDSAMITCNGIHNETYLVMENYRTVWKERGYPKFYEIVQQNVDEYREWGKSFPVTEMKEQRDMAVYLLWVNQVKAEGIMPYDVLYCSKNWMYNIWSWDNCFMSIVLAKKHPELSYNQIRTFFHFQDESGCYPDYVNDKFASYSCTKPPIHAWAYEKMMEQNEYFCNRERLTEAYESFYLVADYWMKYRKGNGKSLPFYTHGNDSGWDNSSVFHKGVPIESPDLTAYLIRQLDILKKYAQQLGREEDALVLEKEADELFRLLMERHYDGKQFYAIFTPTGERIHSGDTLLMYIPIVIGYRLSEDILERLVNDLEQKFEADYGLCTENPKSSYYKKGGYWLGPIWAPVTYIFIDALRENGYKEFAKRLAGKFCRLPEKGLMAENFDPFTGEGYDDPAFSWTSAVFLQLLSEYMEREV